MEDELEGEKIGFLLTLHEAPGLGRICQEVLLSFLVISAATWWSARASGGYLMSSVFSGNMSSGCINSGCLMWGNN